jgi:hypothetical protein
MKHLTITLLLGLAALFCTACATSYEPDLPSNDGVFERVGGPSPATNAMPGTFERVGSGTTY